MCCLLQPEESEDDSEWESASDSAASFLSDDIDDIDDTQQVSADDVAQVNESDNTKKSASECS